MSKMPVDNAVQLSKVVFLQHAELAADYVEQFGKNVVLAALDEAMAITKADSYYAVSAKDNADLINRMTKISAAQLQVRSM